MGRRIRAARRALDLSQASLAVLYDKTDGWIGSIEAGAQFPPPYLIATLQGATGWPYAFFFGEGTDLLPPPPEEAKRKR